MMVRLTRLLAEALIAATAIALCDGTVVAALPGTSISVPVLSATPSMNGVVDSSWSGAAKLTLDMDFTYKRSAEEPTTVYVGQESGYLDVAFVATQREPVTEIQETNGSSVQDDDYVAVALNPEGTQGFAYIFYSNPRGARFQTSSENSAYSPQWTSVGTKTPAGYTVTMRIPLSVIRNGGSTTWRAQFGRYTVATNGLSVWTFSPSASNVTDPSFFGVLRGIESHGRSSARPQPRIQPYLLGELASHSAGGSTSRVGLDAAIPVAPTISFVTSLHPDYSNVEIDQQTIAPTAFPRQFSEVRPFFTQTAQFFDNWFSCSNCPNPLYTPAIPVFSQGYAVEGTEGPATFAAYDAIGDGRSDDAQTANFSSVDAQRVIQFSLQRVGVDAPGLADDTTTLDSGYINQSSHIGAYANLGMDRGTLVTDPQEANYFEGGPFYAGPTTGFGISYQRIGQQFNPIDGYVQQTNLAGYEAYAKEIFNFPAGSALHDIYAFGFYTRFGNDERQLAQATSVAQVNIDFRNLFTIHLYSNNQSVLTSASQFLPFSSNGFALGYKMGYANINGSSSTTSTPSYISYQAGPFYHGKLDAWTYLTTLPLAHHINLALETDEDRYDTVFPGENSTTQWLERISLDWQLSRYAEFDIGARRIVGPNLPNSFQTLSLSSPNACFENPYYPGCMVDAGNVSLAFHFLAARNEFYVVYGNPNSLATFPALYVKWIRYIGAEKGT
jgi:hypothetical protein